MRKYFILISFFLSSYTIGFTQQADTLYILQTTDVHGNIRDYNYFTDAPSDYGLARIYSRVTEYRKKHKNVILIDGGDLIQGTPMIYYFNVLEPDKPNPMILTMNYMGYDAFTVGNHDIEQGLFVYNRAQNESYFPWLSANSILPDGRSYFKPYTIIERNGIKIGIIGLTTPGIPMWLDENLYPGIKWANMVKTAQKYAKILRPNVDVLVGLFHAGFESGYSAAATNKLGLPNENASGLVADKVPEFDLVFAGHSHQLVPAQGLVASKTNTDPLRINAGSWGRNLGVAEIILSSKYQDEKQKTKDNRLKNENTRKEGLQFPIPNFQEKHFGKIVKMSGWLESMKEVEPSKAILQLSDYYHQKTLEYIRQPVAELSQAIDAARSRFEDNALVELINKAQLDYTKTDISFAASFSTHFKMPAGPVLVKDIYSMYRYENFLYTIEMSGQQILDFLTYSARFFVLNEQGNIIANSEMAGYNYDMAEGLRYKILVNQKKNPKSNLEDGQTKNTVADLILIKTGKPLEMDQTYVVAMNSYRASGGGGHLAAAGIQNPKILSKSSMEMRTILSEYLKKLKVINTQCDHNWKVVKGK